MEKWSEGESDGEMMERRREWWRDDGVRDGEKERERRCRNTEVGICVICESVS